MTSPILKDTGWSLGNQCLHKNFTPNPLVYLSSDEEGVARSPMVYPSSCGEGLPLIFKPNLMVYLSSNEEGLAHDPLVYPSSDGEGHVMTPTDT